MKRLLIFLFLCCSFSLTAKEITQINGFAPKYIGQEITISEIVDFVTMKEERIATTTVKEDSTFSCSFYLDETRKLIMHAGKNTASLFAQPGAEYNVFVPDRDPYNAYRPAGNIIELSFYGLEPTDINYKILQFNQWSDKLIATYYTKHNADSGYFVQRLDTFKIDVERYYSADTLDRYFNYHRKFTIAKLDDLKFSGSRNQYEKYDFYIHKTYVYYQNEAYMQYINDYYDQYLQRVNMNTNNKFYLGVLKSSPTLMYNALGTDYTLRHNMKLRELVMIKIIGDIFYDKEYPQSNLLTVLDSLENKSLFPENAIIAKNMKSRLTELVNGGKAPDFTLVANGELLDLKKFSNKHLYLIFVDPNSVNTEKQMDLLVPIFQRYQNEVRFLMVMVGEQNDKTKALAAKYPWQSAVAASDNEMVKKYHVVTFPNYVLIDRIGYIVQSPALGPLPNGNRETIDQVFYQLKKTLEEGGPER